VILGAEGKTQPCCHVQWVHDNIHCVNSPDGAAPENADMDGDSGSGGEEAARETGPPNADLRLPALSRMGLISLDLALFTRSLVALNNPQPATPEGCLA